MTQRSRLEAFHPEEALRHLLDNIKHIIENPRIERNMLVALSASVAKLVEEVRANADLAKAQNQALVILGGQIDDLKGQISSLKAGQTNNEEDVAAINQLVNTVAETNQALQEAVPANTSADANAGKAPTGDQGPLTNGTQPVTSDAAGNPIAPDAPGQPGTDTGPKPSEAPDPAPKVDDTSGVATSPSDEPKP